MMKRIATLLGLIGLAGLLCLVAALTSGCGLPVTKASLQQGLQAELAPLHERTNALNQRVSDLEGVIVLNTETVNKNFGEVEKSLGGLTQEVQQMSGKANLIVKKLGPIGRNAAIASKEATAGKKAAEAASKKIADAQKMLGEKIDTTASTTTAAVTDVDRKVEKATADAQTAHTALDQKVDRRADEVVGAVQGVDRKVDATKTAAEKAATEAELAKTASTVAGSKADAAGAKAEAAGSRAEAAVAKAGADAVVEVGKARKELADHGAEASRYRATIIAELNRLITRPMP